MTTFLTVKEAARLTHKSPSSIRRIIHPIVKSEKHPDRAHIQPDAREALDLRLKGESFGWRVSEELLRRKTALDESRPGGGAASVQGQGDRALLQMLERELRIKNDQIQQQSELIAKQMVLIEGLGERLREGNLLIGSLQQRLALPHPTSRNDHADAQIVTSTSKPKEPPKSSPKKRKRWFQW